jgi:hypothetical protein
MEPKDHPAIRLIGIIDRPETEALPYDPAKEHDRFLADVADPQPPLPSRKRLSR